MNPPATTTPPLPPSATHTEPGWLAYLAACLFTVAMQPVTNMQRLLGVDASLFAYAGKLILRGQVPYADFWDHKAPGIFYIEAAAVRLFGPSWWAPSLLQACFNVAAAAVLVRLSVWLVQSNLARILFVGSSVLALNHFVNADGSNLTETYQTLPLLGAVLLLRPFGPAPSFARLALGGLCLGAALWIRPSALSAGIIAASSLWCRDQAAQPRMQAMGREALAFGSGLGLALVLVVGYFAFHGLAGELWFASLGYNLTVYPDLKQVTPDGLERLFMFRSAHLLWPLYLMGALAWVIYLSGTSTHGRSRAAEQRLVTSLLWASCDVGLALMTRRDYGHYAIALVPSAAFAAAMLLDVACLRTRQVAWAALALGGALIAFCWLPQASMLLGLWRQGVRVAAAPCPTINEHAAQLLAPIMGPKRRVLTWGVFHEVAAMLNAAPATPLLTTLHLRSAYGRRRWATDMVRGLNDEDVVAVVATDAALERAAHDDSKGTGSPMAQTRREVSLQLEAHYERMKWPFDTPVVYVRRELAHLVPKTPTLPATCREYTKAPLNWYTPPAKRKKSKRRTKK